MTAFIPPIKLSKAPFTTSIAGFKKFIREFHKAVAPAFTVSQFLYKAIPITINAVIPIITVAIGFAAIAAFHAHCATVTALTVVAPLAKTAFFTTSAVVIAIV